MKRRPCLTLPLALPLLGGLGPRAAGAAAAEVQDLAWTDPARGGPDGRSLPLRLRLPAGAAPCALVLFSHGLGGSVDAGTQWAQAWAQAGIATLHLQHPGSDRAVLQHGGVAALGRAATAEQLRERARDVRFVLDALARRQAAGEALLARLRLDRVGLAGHSFGAHTVQAVAGQRFGGAEGAGTDLSDPRPRAFAAFSPAPPAQGDARAAFGAIRRPMLCLSGSRDGSPLAGASERATQGAWRRAVYEALPEGDKAELWLDGADHALFGGHTGGTGLRRWRAGPEATAPAQAHAARLIESVTTLWWQAQLLDDASARAQLARPPSSLGPLDAWRRA